MKRSNNVSPGRIWIPVVFFFIKNKKWKVKKKSKKKEDYLIANLLWKPKECRMRKSWKIGSFYTFLHWHHHHWVFGIQKEKKKWFLHLFQIFFKEKNRKVRNYFERIENKKIKRKYLEQYQSIELSWNIYLNGRKINHFLIFFFFLNFAKKKKIAGVQKLNTSKFLSVCFVQPTKLKVKIISTNQFKKRKKQQLFLISPISLFFFAFIFFLVPTFFLKPWIQTFKFQNFIAYLFLFYEIFVVIFHIDNIIFFFFRNRE